MRCEDKHAYPTKAIAKQHAALSLRARGIELFVYKCPHCKQWHLTKWKWENAS